MEIVILKSPRVPRYHDRGVVNSSLWSEITDHLNRRKHKVYDSPRDADVSIVLSGMMENPAIIKGRKVLAFKPQEWILNVPPPKGWMLYKPILELYYDDMIDLSGLNAKKSAKRIIEYIDEIKESGSKD